MVSYTNRRGGSDIFVTGVQDDIALAGAGALFVSKRRFSTRSRTPVTSSIGLNNML